LRRQSRRPHVEQDTTHQQNQVLSEITHLRRITETSPGDQKYPVWINDEFEAVVTNPKAAHTKTGKAYATATLQDPHSNNFAIDATFWIAGIPAKQGKVCHFSGQGMKLEEYKGNLKLTIGDKAKINVVGGAPARAAAPAAGARTATRPATTQGAAQGGKKPIHGATVGMAINQAIGIIQSALQHEQVGLGNYYLTPAFGQDLHTLASDIIRVSTYLEAGNLAAPSSKRTPAPDSAPAEPEPEPEPQVQGGGDGTDQGEDVPFAPARM